MTRFCLIRHGQTDWNLEGRYQGQSDVPLNETGLAQARALALLLQKETFSAVYSSNLKRAVETAAIVAASLGLAVTLEPRLREIDQGDWEGQLVGAIQARYAHLWEQRAVNPASVRPPNGETVAEVAQRVYAALDDIARVYPGKKVLIASHGLALATVLCRVKGIPVGKAYNVIPGNADPVWVEWSA